MTDDDVPFVWGVEDKYRHSQTKTIDTFIKLRDMKPYKKLAEDYGYKVIVKSRSENKYIDYLNSNGTRIEGNTGLDYTINAYLEDRITNSTNTKMVSLAKVSFVNRLFRATNI